jgi:hypothetical protein
MPKTSGVVGVLMDVSLSVADLLAAPQMYDGRMVTVTGYYVGEREHHAVYASPAEFRTLSGGVWLEHEATVGGSKRAARLNRGWVRLTGVFHNRRRSGVGHFNAFSASLSGIRDFEPAESPDEGKV